jgi:hypothetical protein
MLRGFELLRVSEVVDNAACSGGSRLVPEPRYRSLKLWQGYMQVASVLTVGSIITLSNMVPTAFQSGYPSTTGFRKVVNNTQHAQKAVPILQRYGIVSYSLVIDELSIKLCVSLASEFARYTVNYILT